MAHIRSTPERSGAQSKGERQPRPGRPPSRAGPLRPPSGAPFQVPRATPAAACSSGQRVIAFTMQPELRLPRLSWLGHTMAMRKVDLAHLVILTDSELIVIRDDPSSLGQLRRHPLRRRLGLPALSRVCEASLTSAPPARPCSCACPATSASKCSSPRQPQRSGAPVRLHPGRLPAR